MVTEAVRTIEYQGKFCLLRRIASGGMATVYEAEQVGDRGFTKRVALKVIHEKYARQPEWLQLFIDEAKLSANLVHGNIVQIFQFEEVAGEFYIAMEYIRGVTLRALIDHHRAIHEPVPPPLAAYIVSRVCRALDYAHTFVDQSGARLHIVHRDVSPGNVLITWDGQVKLADFGIAKARTMHDPAAEQNLTIGKKHYMSPQQVVGGMVDWRTDIFSTGVVLFEVLALQQLFREVETEASMDEVTIAPTPDIRRLLPDLDSRNHGTHLARDRQGSDAPPQRGNAGPRPSTTGAPGSVRLARPSACRPTWRSSFPRRTARRARRSGATCHPATGDKSLWSALDDVFRAVTQGSALPIPLHSRHGEQDLYEDRRRWRHGPLRRRPRTQGSRARWRPTGPSTNSTRSSGRPGLPT